jgi:hypothetical protein
VNQILVRTPYVSATFPFRQAWPFAVQALWFLAPSVLIPLSQSLADISTPVVLRPGFVKKKYTGLTRTAACAASIIGEHEDDQVRGVEPTLPTEPHEDCRSENGCHGVMPRARPLCKRGSRDRMHTSSVVY